jgi:Holliday junction resolvase RusA-like endonuclease
LQIHFRVEGRPRGKGRPRFNRKTGTAITPKGTAEAERAVAKACRLAMGSAPIMTGTVELTIEAVFRVPSSWPNARRAAALAGEIEYTGKPDRDNIEKLVMDALNDVAYIDDAQVNRGPPVVRRYGEPERTEVTVREIKAADEAHKSPAERRREVKALTGDYGKGKRRAASPHKSKSGKPPTKLMLAIMRAIARDDAKGPRGGGNGR